MSEGVVRAGLVTLWCVAGGLCLWRRAAGFVACGVLCLLLASIRGLRWNYLLGGAVKAAARDILPGDLLVPARAAGLAGLALASVAVLVVLARRRAGGLFVTACGLLTILLLVGIETAGADEILPAAVARLPGRFVAEGAGAALALAGTLGRSR